MHMFAKIVSTSALAVFAMIPAQSLADTKPAIAITPAAAAAPSAIPSAESLVILIRTNLIAFNQANLTNDYSVFHALGSTKFKNANSLEQLAAAFEAFRTNRIDLSPTVLIAPQLKATPTITNGLLQLDGFFPTRPLQVNYVMTFEQEQGAWKLFGMTVNLNPAPAKPAAAKPAGAKPAPAPAPAPAPKKPADKPAETR